MFLGRKRELESLDKLYQSSGFAMTVIYGRRRIGKSTLIRKFIEDKHAIFYTAARVGAVRNLELFSEQVVATLEPSLSDVQFPSLESILDFITNRLGDEKLILVIDELPYWAKSDESLLFILQKFIDTMWLDKQLLVILCGSALSFMEDKILSEKSPLFGRRNSQIKLDAFDYIDSALFVPNYTFEEKAICYGITGGVAKYLYSLDKLISIGLVEKKHCITEEKNKKKTMYVLRDHMFKFWYKFIPKANSIIEIGGGGYLL